MKLGIAARQPTRVAVVIRSFIGKRREKADLRARRPPAVQQMRIQERERRILGDGHKLARR